jgi:hypothetical protein
MSKTGKREAARRFIESRAAMPNEVYRATQSAIIDVAEKLGGLDLTGFVERTAAAKTLAPDTTSRDSAAMLLEIGRRLLEFKRAVERSAQRLERRP